MYSFSTCMAGEDIAPQGRAARAHAEPQEGVRSGQAEAGRKLEPHDLAAGKPEAAGLDDGRQLGEVVAHHLRAVAPPEPELDGAAAARRAWPAEGAQRASQPAV